jgi:hypothetical protein
MTTGHGSHATSPAATGTTIESITSTMSAEMKAKIVALIAAFMQLVELCLDTKATEQTADIQKTIKGIAVEVRRDQLDGEIEQLTSNLSRLSKQGRKDFHSVIGGLYEVVDNYIETKKAPKNLKEKLDKYNNLKAELSQNDSQDEGGESAAAAPAQQ